MSLSGTFEFNQALLNLVESWYEAHVYCKYSQSSLKLSLNDSVESLGLSTISGFKGVYFLGNNVLTVRGENYFQLMRTRNIFFLPAVLANIMIKISP